MAINSLLRDNNAPQQEPIVPDHTQTAQAGSISPDVLSRLARPVSQQPMETGQDALSRLSRPVVTIPALSEQASYDTAQRAPGGNRRHVPNFNWDRAQGHFPDAQLGGQGPTSLNPSVQRLHQSQEAQRIIAQDAPMEFDAAKERAAQRYYRAQAPITGRISAAIRGIGSGMLMEGDDEAEASLNATVGTGRQGGTWEERYHRNLNRARAIAAADAEDRFAERLIGQVVGSVLVPIGLGVQGVRGLAGLGAGMGAATGFNSGEGFQDRASQGIAGAAIGAGIGVATPAVANQLGRGIDYLRATRSNFGDYLRMPGLQRLDDIANERIARTAIADQRTPADISNRIQQMSDAGYPSAVIDGGGENMRTLLRTSTNYSPTANQMVSDVAEQRNLGQAERFLGYIRRAGGTRGDWSGDIDQVREAARVANAPLYTRAYEAGDRPLGGGRIPGVASENDPNVTLQRLLTSRSVQAAFQTAVERSSDDAVRMGYTPFNPRVELTTDGRVLYQNNQNSGLTTYPNLQFWDLAYRSLRGAGRKAIQEGDDDHGRRLLGLSNQMRNALDDLVPEYGAARGSAARFFNAENAVDAGTMLLGSNQPLSTFQRLWRTMPAEEQEMFRRGLYADLYNRIERSGDRRNLINQNYFNNPTARGYLETVFGREEFGRLATRIDAERVGSLVGKLNSNSTTARQLIAAGIVSGSAGMALSGGDFTVGTGAALAGAAARRRAGAQSAQIEREVADRVARILLSPQLGDEYERGIAMIANSEKLSRALSNFAGQLSALNASLGGRTMEGITNNVNPLLQGTRPVRPEDEQNSSVRPQNNQPN